MSDRQLLPRNYMTATLVLLAGLLVTGYAAYAVKAEIESGVQRQFAFDCSEIQSRIEQRLQAHRLVLLGGAALFNASDRVTRDGWRAYAARVEIDQHFHGIQGLGFSLLIPKQQLALHTSEIRSQGFPEYGVSPAGERDVYSSIIYLEPFKDRNLRAFGYDMYSEQVRRAAMQRARDENIVALSGKVELVQETGKDVQAGTLMYVPVYRKSVPLETVEQRRAALYGWVYSPFRMDDLLLGMLEGWRDPKQQQLRLQVYDGHTLNADNLLYDSQSGQEGAAAKSALFSLEQHVNFNGHEWTLHFEQLRGSESGTDYSKAWIVLAGGAGLSLLLFLLMLSYLNTRRNAARIAAGLTAELREASGYARSLIEASLDPLVTISAEGKITDVNCATEQVTGRSRAELVGTDFSDYFTEPDQAREGYRQVFSEGSVTDYPLSIRHRDGHVTDVLYNASLYRGAAGNVLGVFAAARDITELEQAEESIRISQTRFSAIFNQAPLGIALIDSLTGKIHEVNPRFAQIAGRTIEEMAIIDWMSITHPDDVQEDMDNMALMNAGKIPGFNMDKRYLRPDGSFVWINMTIAPLRGEQSISPRHLCMIDDITERKQMEEEVAQSEALFRNYFELGQVGMAITSLDQKWLQVNRRLCEILGFTREELVNMTWTELTHPDDIEPDLVQFRKMLSGEIERYSMEKRFFRKGGSITYTYLTVSCQRKPDGAVNYVIASVQDITERKQMEEEIIKLNRGLELRVIERTAELEAANKELESFSYSVSHDLRVPLRAIDGFSRLVLNRYEEKLDDEGKRLLNVVRDNTKKMGQLIDDILAFSRAGRLEIRTAETDMEALAREVWQELEQSITGWDVHLEIKPLPKVQGDPAMLRQVWANLLGNAAKFTKPRITAHIEVGSSVAGNECTFYVKDNGVGFDQRYVDKLFGVFQRLHGVDEFEGTGIGLAIVKRIITRHGGRVWAEGKINEGAVFYFALPINQNTVSDRLNASANNH